MDKSKVLILLSVIIVSITAVAFASWKWADSSSIGSVSSGISSPFGSIGDTKKYSVRNRNIYRVLKSCKEQLLKYEKAISKQSGAFVAKNEGHIKPDTPFGAQLSELAAQEDVSLFLEIGTFTGGGSSLAIGKAMLDSGKKEKMLYSIELYEPHWENARELLKKYPVRCILGSTVGTKDYLKPEEIDSKYKDEHYSAFFKKELSMVEYFEPMLEVLCKNHKFDAILHDGGEFTGPAEFEIIEKVCQPKYLALRNGDDWSCKSSAWMEHLKSHAQVWKEYKSGSDPYPWWIYVKADEL